MELFTKNESGEYIPATDEQYEEAFRDRSDKIVRKRLATSLEKALEEKRPEFEKKIREETITKIREEVEGEYKPKVDEAEKRAAALEQKLQRRDILNEYGLKKEAEEFLGNGTAEEMRARADKLKGGFSNEGVKSPEKSSGEQKSEVQEKYGLDIKI